MTINPNDLANTATLTFSDDFNSLSLWNGQSGTWNTGDSWGNEKGFTLSGNGEQEWYINSQYAPTQSIKPWSVSNGVLDITAQPASDATKQLIGDHDYTSGQINTFHSFSQTYGYFEMRAELPEGKGLWPAFWLLPEDNSWPPEIDVMENLGDNMKVYAATVHTAETGSHTQTSTGVDTPDLSAGFHNYGVDWEADKITWYFDGKQVFQTDTPSDMNKPAYMVANLAVGGYWPGNPDGSTQFPATMKIDYIHAYSAKPDGATDTSSTTADPTHTTSPATDATHTTSPATDATHTTDTAQAGSTDSTHAAPAPSAPAPSDPTPQPASTDTSHSTTVGTTDASHATGGAQTGTVADPVAAQPSTETSHPAPAPADHVASASSDPAPSTTSVDHAPAPAAPAAATTGPVSAPSTGAAASGSTASDQFDFGALRGHHGHHGHQDHHGQHGQHGHAQSHAFDHFDWSHAGATASQSATTSDVAQGKWGAALAALQEHAEAFAQAHGSQDGAGFHGQQHHFEHHLF